MLTLAVVNLKGGTGKTTSSAYTAHVLHEVGHRVLVVDSDPQGSALTWHESAEWPFPVVGLPSGKLHREIAGVTGDRFDAVVVDTPPSEHHSGIVVSALRAATHVIVPMAPTPAEYERLRALRSLIDDAAELRPDGRPPIVAVLLVRTVAGAASTGAYRELLTEDGWTVLRPTVGRLERYAQAFGGPIERALATGYGDAVAELLAIDEEVSA